MKLYKLRDKEGFLLLELLIAILIAAVIFSGILAVLGGGIASYKKIDRLSYPMYQARAFFALLENQLHNMLYFSDAPFTGDKQKFTFPAVLENYSEDTLLDIPASITYEYREKALYRTKTPLRDLFTEKRGDSEKILSSLNSFIVQYAYRQSENSDIIWLESWPSGKGLPRGIKISLSLEIPSEKKERKMENFIVTRKFFIPHGNWGWIEKEA